ncbi:UDP-N-acetylmuramoyl-tripeptide--D-alanyl-D-alanine ligase [Sphingomonas cavernae]|uniref:UDP-N-acetylmuramoyl-tripeptide--D-alanyl-D-alanine ligase n=1 Tax=Sphingomonas cavernae TaxID=2320861 RepID=A0A418WKG6_9SPHN|nr:UDP-N-acetylmuramoyl-tripeptide--D-alanyl-D-alanine ligase [Sphingomonas cavernae]RJF90526.1 UDP-N-acetylmuramoyl-tripeptide--D-alanyl-D-alanine ligase [Sphingomonas cavernae]
MSVLWTSEAIAEATGGSASADFSVQGVAFDSREIGPRDLFIAMKGEATDGHRFIDQAFASGAAGAIVSEAIDYPHILVADTTAALGALGVASRARTSAKIAGVTGSVGKTGTKEALFAALDRFAPGHVHRSVKSYNNHTGVPLSLARMPEDTQFGIFEMGMSAPGELAALTRLVRPHVAVVTAIAPAHQAYFDSIEQIADAKGEIFQGLEPGGTAIVPFDSPYRDRLIAAAEPYAAKILTFGHGEGADVRARDVVRAANGGSLVTANFPDAELCFTVAFPGEHWVSNALAVLAAVEALGGDLAQAGLALADLEGLAGRGARHRVPVKDGTALVIDESYNANPASMAATIRQLGKEEAERRIVLLGSMRELGRESDRYHAELVEPLAAANVDFALLIGDEMRPLAKALEGRIEFVHRPDAASALERLSKILEPGDAVLIKGSNAIGLSRVVDSLVSGALGGRTD